MVESKYSTLLSRKNSVKAKQQEAKRKAFSFTVKAGLALLVIFILVLNFNLFLMMRRNLSEIRASEQRVREYSINSMRMGADVLEKVNPQILTVDEKIQVLERELDVQKVAIENLTKAKNTLFKRMSESEVELDDLKKENQLLSSEITTLTHPAVKTNNK